MKEKEYALLTYTRIGDSYIFEESRVFLYKSPINLYKKYGGLSQMCMYVPVGEEKLYSGLLRAELRDKIKDEIKHCNNLLNSMEN